MMMLTNQQHQEQMQRQQDHDEEREERCTRSEEQHEERRMQMQIHLDNMHQQSQFMTTMMWEMMGNQGAWTASIIPPVIPPLGINHGHEATQ